MNAKTQRLPFLGGDLFTAGMSVTASLQPFSALETLFVFDCEQPQLAKSALSSKSGAERLIYAPAFVLWFSFSLS